MFSRRTAWDTEPNRLARAIDEARGRGLSWIDLTESNPTRAGLGDPALIGLLGHPRGAGYSPKAMGRIEAREAVARYYAARGIAVDPERVVLSASTSEAYGWLFKLLCERGDEVMVPAPSYPLFDWLAALEDVSLIPYPLVRQEGFRADVGALERALSPRSRAVMMVHPNNPTGSFVRRAEAEAIEALAEERDLALVVDEVFCDYPLEEPLPADVVPSFAGRDNALGFVLSGLSKVVAMPQLKVGWTVVSGPISLVEEALRRLDVIADTYLSVNTPAELALPELLAAAPAVQAKIRARTRQNLRALDRAIAAMGPDAPVRRLAVMGGWYAIVEVPRTEDDERWVERLLLEDAVLVHPGFFFDMDREGFLVVSLLPEPTAFEEAARRMAARVCS